MVQFVTTLTNAQAGFKTDNHINSKGQFKTGVRKNSFVPSPSRLCQYDRSDFFSRIKF